MTAYPKSLFHFLLDWGGPEGTEVGFAEISGLAHPGQQINDYRGEHGSEHRSRVMPGINSYSNVTLKRGIAASNNQFLSWLNSISRNMVERRDLTISLLDENKQPVASWKINNAWPVKVEGTVLNAEGDGIAIESVEIAHEGLEVV